MVKIKKLKREAARIATRLWFAVKRAKFLWIVAILHTAFIVLAPITINGFSFWANGWMWALTASITMYAWNDFRKREIDMWVDRNLDRP